MSKLGKLLLGAGTIWPILYMFIFMGAAFSAVIFGESEPAALWAVIIPLHLLTMLLIFGLMVFYVVNVFRNDRIKPDMKALWAIVLFMGNAFAIPIYWYLYIWRDDPKALQGVTNPSSLPDSSTMQNQHVRDASYVPPSQPPDWR
jgi:hypothetical protein